MVHEVYAWLSKRCSKDRLEQLRTSKFLIVYADGWSRSCCMHVPGSLHVWEERYFQIRTEKWEVASKLEAFGRTNGSTVDVKLLKHKWELSRWCEDSMQWKVVAVVTSNAALDALFKLYTNDTIIVGAL